MASHRFASIKELLRGAALEVVKTTGSTAALVPIWAEAVGPSIAKNATPTAIYGDTLVVRCDTKLWADALALREPEIVAKLKDSLKINRLRLEVQK